MQCSSVHTHSSHQQAHVALFFAYFASVRIFRVISQCTAIGYNFVVFLSVLLRNLQTNYILLDRGRLYHSTRYSIFNFCFTSSFSRIHILLYLLTAQIQLYSCTDPGPSPTQRSHSHSGRFNPVCCPTYCVSFSDLQNIFLCKFSPYTSFFFLSFFFNPVRSFQIVCVIF